MTRKQIKELMVMPMIAVELTPCEVFALLTKENQRDQDDAVYALRAESILRGAFEKAALESRCGA